MNRDEYNAFCRSLPAATYVMQWGGSDVWKVGGKVFAIFGRHQTGGITFKVSDIAFEILKNQPGLRPAPYLASRGLLWIQHFDEPGLNDDELKRYITHSHALVAQGLPKKKRAELRLDAVKEPASPPVRSLDPH